MKQGLPPILDLRTEILILGSFPGEASLQKQQYYGHSQNQFWKLIGSILRTDLVSISYTARVSTLRKHKIGLWDVYATCHREGSLDTNIKNPKRNDFKRIRELAPNVRKICFNGKTSGKFEKQFRELGYKTAVLHSSSPAHTLSFEEKLKDWQAKILTGND